MRAAGSLAVMLAAVAGCGGSSKQADLQEAVRVCARSAVGASSAVGEQSNLVGQCVPRRVSDAVCDRSGSELNIVDLPICYYPSDPAHGVNVSVALLAASSVDGGPAAPAPTPYSPPLQEQTADPTPVEAPTPASTAEEVANDLAMLKAFFRHSDLTVSLVASQGDPESVPVVLHGVHVDPASDGTVTVTATVKNNGHVSVHPKMSVVFAGNNYQGPSDQADRWFAEAQTGDSYCISPGGTGTISWSDNVPTAFQQVLLEDSGTKSNDC